jgi:hypothetical protein
MEGGSVPATDPIMISVSPEEFRLLIHLAGRVRKGPAPLNLEIPEYDFADENTLVVG